MEDKLDVVINAYKSRVNNPNSKKQNVTTKSIKNNYFYMKSFNPKSGTIKGYSIIKKEVKSKLLIPKNNQNNYEWKW